MLFAAFYLVALNVNLVSNEEIPVIESEPAKHQTVAIVGASGTAGDGILKAALADPDIKQILAVTRRATPRIEKGVASGKVQMILHMDYLDYSTIHERLVPIDTVYWAIGTSTFGVGEETYGMIHVDFSVRFVTECTRAGSKSDGSFHYISSSDISEDSSMM